MIGLNKIGLNQVQLNQLYLNTLCACQKSSGSDGFPRLPGDVTRWSFKGLTNEQMSKNPRLEDADHKGRFLTFKNFAWSGMSGCGGYSLSKETFSYTPDIYSFNFTDPEGGLKIFDVYFQLIGLEENSGVTFNLDIRESGTSKRIKRETYTKDGIYHFEYKSEDDATNVYMIGYNGDGEDRTTFTVKILPYYAGALVFDGVDDYGICENFPILTKEKGYTVVALRQYLVDKSTAYLTTNGDSIQNTSFIFEGNNYKDTWNFGKVTVIHASRILATQTSKQYDGVKLHIGTNTEGSNLLQVGKWGKSYSNSAIWELVFLDHDATEEELTKIKNYFIKTYPWLFFDQAWTVVGKSNEDTDRATIANITGNDNNLALQNFGFIEGSGYNEEGEYAGYLVTDGVDDIIRSSAFTVGKDWTTVGEWEFLKEDAIKIAGIAKFNSFRFYNYSFIGRMNVYINSDLGTNVIGESVKAATSKGSVYLDFNSVTEVTPGDEVDLGQSLFIGYNVNNFTKLAFKNLAIYSAVLSKEDMIKAYIYLQTLKAK